MALKSGGMQIRLTPAERNRLEEIAEMKEISLTEAVRAAIRECAFSPDVHVEAVQKQVYTRTPESLRNALESMSMLGSSLWYYNESLDLVDFFDLYSKFSNFDMKWFDEYREYFAKNLMNNNYGKDVDADCELVAQKFLDSSVSAQDVLDLQTKLYRKHWDVLFESTYTYRNLEVASRFMLFNGSQMDFETVYAAAKRAASSFAFYAATHETAGKKL